MNYEAYSTEDFLSDDYFLQWVKHPDAENTAFWTAWLAQHPEKKQTVEDAKKVIHSLQFENDQLEDHKVIKIQQAIHNQLDKVAPQIPSAAQRQIHSWYWVAASLILAMVAGGVLLFQQTLSQAQEWVTDYGETRTIILPDSSKVTLNANSRITYNTDWQEGAREVFLEGEAYFEVKRITSSTQNTEGYRKFTVHSGEVNVEVLGTTFNVHHRHGETEVVLNTGKVKISGIRSEEVVMVPGELVQFKEQQLSRKVVNPEMYISWKENRLVFDETPLHEIIRILEDNYNYEVVLQDESLGQKKFVGTFPADDISILLQTLAKSVEIKKDQNKLILGAKR